MGQQNGCFLFVIERRFKEVSVQIFTNGGIFIVVINGEKFFTYPGFIDRMIGEWFYL